MKNMLHCFPPNIQTFSGMMGAAVEIFKLDRSIFYTLYCLITNFRIGRKKVTASFHKSMLCQLRDSGLFFYVFIQRIWPLGHSEESPWAISFAFNAQESSRGLMCIWRYYLATSSTYYIQIFIGNLQRWENNTDDPKLNFRFINQFSWRRKFLFSHINCVFFLLISSSFQL